MSEKNNTPSTAVALKYDGDSAPQVIAKGEAHLAEKIVAIAKEHGIVLYQDSELVKLLARLDLNQEIPANLYQAVAAVLAFVYTLNGKAGEFSKDDIKKHKQQHPFDIPNKPSDE